MEVKQIRPQGIYVDIEMSLEELIKLRDVLGLARIHFNGEKPDEVAAKTYLENEFYPQLNKLVEDLNNES